MSKHDEPHEVTEAYKALRYDQQSLNAKNLADGTWQIKEIAPMLGLTITPITEYQIRLTDGKAKIDLWPTNAKYHNITTGKRKWYDRKNLESFLRKEFGI